MWSIVFFCPNILYITIKLSITFLSARKSNTGNRLPIYEHHPAQSYYIARVHNTKPENSIVRTRFIKSRLAKTRFWFTGCERRPKNRVHPGASRSGSLHSWQRFFDVQTTADIRNCFRLPRDAQTGETVGRTECKYYTHWHQQEDNNIFRRFARAMNPVRLLFL